MKRGGGGEGAKTRFDNDIPLIFQVGIHLPPALRSLPPPQNLLIYTFPLPDCFLTPEVISHPPPVVPLIKC